MSLVSAIRAAIRRFHAGRTEMPRTSEPSRQVLVIARDAVLTQRIADVVAEHGLDPVVITSARFGLELADRTEHPLIVCDVPLPDMPLGEFARELRSPQRSRRQGSLLILTASERRAEVQRELGGGATTVLVRHAPTDLVRTVIERLLSVSPRRRPTGVVFARIVPEINTSPLACPVVNLSVSGVLVITQRLLPVGTRCQVELTSERSGESLVVGGWVVRHHPSVTSTDPLHDRMAVQFLDTGGPTRDRLLHFVEAV